MTRPKSTPFAEGSISLGLYLEDLEPSAALEEMLLQAAIANDSGFDGITLSEHHAAFEGYLPTPILGTSWILEHVDTAWAGPCPLILPIRPLNLMLEEMAWLASRYPGRLGVGLAPGFAVDDFLLANASVETRRADFYRNLGPAVRALRGEAEGPLGDDPAIKRCGLQTVPVVGAVAGPVAAAKAAEAGAGMLIATFKGADRAREFSAIYKAHNGAGPRVLVRRCWVGERPSRGGLHSARSPGGERSAPRTWANGDRTDMVTATTAEEMAQRLHSRLMESDATALNIRLQLPGSTPVMTREQIQRFGSEVLPRLRRLIQDTSHQLT
jgi:alkanesulfonate monooxygenase SsuD/methylene tetrahydromethanopterin reductase-like flavin-dependent oxidoreductase (luciferase family)